ncbi:variable surface lipoprotein, partial [Mycoplasmopsis meleagridis]|uniref:variable surface lipoprotein n=2 Tax=Mycoplasmopsis meleagridis TaxID=29561 RepID=UPI000614BD6C
MKKFKLLLGLSLAASVIAPLAAISCVNEDTNPPVNEENPDSTTNDNNLSNPSASGDSTTGESSGSTDTN